jgi:hypothetical protein
VYEEADGRQYVVDDEGQRIEGVWLLPPDQAVVVFVM